MPVVEIQDLRKTYSGVVALKNVSLSVDQGEIFGLLGHNGAGKSTMIKILLGIVKKTEGEAYLLGQPAGDVAVRKRVGYLPEDHAFPLYHTAVSLLDFYGRLYGLTANERRKRIDEALDIVGIAKRKHYKISTYSKGMKQRLGIASAFFHDPEVIFLDEPTDGVDPVGRKEIRDLLLDLKREGRTIFVNSHILGELEMISDRAAILDKGQLIRVGTIAELTKADGRYLIGLAPGQEFPAALVEKLGYRCRDEGGYTEILVGSDEHAIDQVLRLIHEHGLQLRHLVEKKESLEDVFVRSVEQAESGRETRGTRASRPLTAAPAKARRVES